MSTKPSRIELDKEDGITVQLINGATTQTLTIDGNKITMEVKGPLGASTIVQDQSSVTIKCDNFVVDSKTLRCAGSMSALLQSGPSTLELSPANAALAAPETSVSGESMANVQAPAITVTAVEALTLTAPAGVVEVDGLTVSITGETGTEVEAPLITFIGVPDFE
jgi:hypothetical protein